MPCRWCFSISRGKLSPLHEASTDFQGHSSQTIIINSLLFFQLVFENDWVIVLLEVTDCSSQNYNNFHVYAQIVLCVANWSQRKNKTNSAQIISCQLWMCTLFITYHLKREGMLLWFRFEYHIFWRCVFPYSVSFLVDVSINTFTPQGREIAAHLMHRHQLFN